MSKRYHDSRDVDREKYRHMTPAEWQASQLEKSDEEQEDEPLHKRPRLPTERGGDITVEKGQPVSVKPEKKKRYKAEDFTYKDALRERVDSWFLQYPVLRKRNFYTVQNHHATSKHFDLRLHINGGLFSFAIPRGLVLKSERDAFSSKSSLSRLAVETTIHPLNYALFEGVGGTGTTGVWDIGEYRVHLSKKKEKARKKLLEQGIDDQETTDEEDEEGDEKLEEDERQEDLLRNAIQRSSFSSGRVQEVSTEEGKFNPDKGEYRGFVLELIGARYKGLRFTLARNSSDFRHVKRGDSNCTSPFSLSIFSFLSIKAEFSHTLSQWYLTLSDPSGTTPLSRIENPSLSPLKSLLTGRTMEEIGKAGGAKPRGRAKAKVKKVDAGEDTTDAEKEGEDEGMETQGLLDVEGNGLKWFEDQQKLRRKGGD
ncbi:hypothetical protein JCM5353_004004 [Sporobolomyces roseus]